MAFTTIVRSRKRRAFNPTAPRAPDRFQRPPHRETLHLKSLEAEPSGPGPRAD